MKTIKVYKQMLLILTSFNIANGVWLPKVVLPEKIIVGYANWQQCDDKIIEAAKNGVNTIIWFSIDLLHNYTIGKPYINRGPDPNCVAQTAKTLKELQLETIHLISIGGWNSLHPDTTNTPQQIFDEWKRWNNEVVAKPELQFFGYDGIDWDIEGTDVVANERNQFKVETLNLMGQLSQLFKREGYIVSMAPAESYMDPTTSTFDRSLRHTYSEWDPIEPGFYYHGHNTYSYILSRYGTTSVDTDQEIALEQTFDFITIQLYEGYSHCLYNTSILRQPASEYIRNIVQKFQQGWYVNFSSDVEISWNSRVVQIPPARLVIGLANGWADNTKFLLLDSTEVGLAYQYLNEIGLAPKGFGFWNIFDEGRTTVREEELWLAKDLDNILRIRSSSANRSSNVGFMCFVMCLSIVIGYNFVDVKLRQDCTK